MYFKKIALALLVLMAIPATSFATVEEDRQNLKKDWNESLVCLKKEAAEMQVDIAANKELAAEEKSLKGSILETKNEMIKLIEKTVGSIDALDEKKIGEARKEHEQLSEKINLISLKIDKICAVREILEKLKNVGETDPQAKLKEMESICDGIVAAEEQIYALKRRAADLYAKKEKMFGEIRLRELEIEKKNITDKMSK